MPVKILNNSFVPHHNLSNMLFLYGNDCGKLIIKDGIKLKSVKENSDFNFLIYLFIYFMSVKHSYMRL